MKTFLITIILTMPTTSLCLAEDLQKDFKFNTALLQYFKIYEKSNGQDPHLSIYKDRIIDLIFRSIRPYVSENSPFQDKNDISEYEERLTLIASKYAQSQAATSDLANELKSHWEKIFLTDFIVKELRDLLFAEGLRDLAFLIMAIVDLHTISSPGKISKAFNTLLKIIFYSTTSAHIYFINKHQANSKQLALKTPPPPVVFFSFLLLDDKQYKDIPPDDFVRLKNIKWDEFKDSLCSAGASAVVFCGLKFFCTGLKSTPISFIISLGIYFIVDELEAWHTENTYKNTLLSAIKKFDTSIERYSSDINSTEKLKKAIENTEKLVQSALSLMIYYDKAIYEASTHYLLEIQDNNERNIKKYTQDRALKICNAANDRPWQWLRDPLNPHSDLGWLSYETAISKRLRYVTEHSQEHAQEVGRLLRKLDVIQEQLAIEPSLSLYTEQEGFRYQYQAITQITRIRGIDRLYEKYKAYDFVKEFAQKDEKALKQALSSVDNKLQRHRLDFSEHFFTYGFLFDDPAAQVIKKIDLWEQDTDLALSSQMRSGEISPHADRLLLQVIALLKKKMANRDSDSFFFVADAIDKLKAKIEWKQKLIKESLNHCPDEYSIDSALAEIDDYKKAHSFVSDFSTGFATPHFSSKETGSFDSEKGGSVEKNF